MFKRLLSVLAVTFVAGSLYAETAPRRYLVATRGPAPVSFEALRVDIERNDAGRNFHRFENVDGFVADLTDAEVATLKRSRQVLYVEPDREIHAFPLLEGHERIRAVRPRSTPSPVTASSTRSQSTPYGIGMVNAPLVWAQARGAAIKVGVIDSGVDRNHPDLQPVFRGGFDFVENDDDPNDPSGHGTHVAGTIAAADNALGVVGVAPEVELFGLRVLGANGSGSVSNEIKAVDWAIANGLHVINLSLGADDKSFVEEQAFERAAAAGVLAVAAAGNDGGLQLSYPAGYSSVISVGAVDENFAIAGFSNQGTGLRVVAPGVRIYSTYPLGKGSISDVLDSKGIAHEAVNFDRSPQATLTGPIVSCGLGKPGEFPSSVNGAIALIQRGELTFADKVKNAQQAGAIAVIVFDNIDQDIHSSIWTLGEEPRAWPLSVFVSKATGAELLKEAGKSIEVSYRPDDYTSLQGTSMATPHVAGVAALVWSVAPSASADQVRNAIMRTAIDLGAPGWDTTFGYGMVDAYAAARYLAPGVLEPLPQRRRGAGR